MYMLESVSVAATLITAYEASQLNRDSHFLSVLCSLFSKAIFFIFMIPKHNEHDKSPK